MVQHPDPTFFTDLNRLIEVAKGLAQQNRFAEARDGFFAVLEFAAARQVTIPISLIFDMWTHLFWCAMRDHKFVMLDATSTQIYWLYASQNSFIPILAIMTPTNVGDALV